MMGKPATHQGYARPGVTPPPPPPWTRTDRALGNPPPKGNWLNGIWVPEVAEIDDAVALLPTAKKKAKKEEKNTSSEDNAGATSRDL